MGMVVALNRDPELLKTFQECLGGKDPKTVRAYMQVLRNFVAWLATRPGGSPFRPEILTETAVKGYLDHLADLGRAPRTRSKSLAAINRFCRWVQDEGLLRRNPASRVERPTVAQMAPKELSADQRFALKNVVERIGSPRLTAIFALGYWAGLRVSEVSKLRVSAVQVNQRAGSLTVADGKGGKTRTIDLCNEARRALYEYLNPEDGVACERDRDSEFMFTSQRSAWLRQQNRPDNLSERGIEHLWTNAKPQATRDEWELIMDVGYHDLRHDFAHRARAAGWSLEEVAVYLGHQTKDGAPAINTTVRYTLPSRQQLKERLQSLQG
jgi:site-specific recombinase XerD